MKPERCGERSLLFISRIYLNLPIATSQVKGRKPFCSRQTVERIVYSWKRVYVLFSNVIYATKINTESKRTVLLSSQHNRRRPCTLRRFYDSLLQHPVDHVLHYAALMKGQPATLLPDRQGITRVNFMT